MGVLPPHPLLYDGMLIASATEMLLLSLALADRITAERHARTEADLQRAREQVAREEAQRALEENPASWPRSRTTCSNPSTR